MARLRSVRVSSGCLRLRSSTLTPSLTLEEQMGSLLGWEGARESARTELGWRRPWASKQRSRQGGTLLWQRRMATISESFLPLLSCSIRSDRSSPSPTKHGKAPSNTASADTPYSYLLTRKRKRGPSNCSLLITSASQNDFSSLRSMRVQRVSSCVILLTNLDMASKGETEEESWLTGSSRAFLGAARDSNLSCLAARDLVFLAGERMSSSRRSRGRSISTSGSTLLLMLPSLRPHTNRSSRPTYSSTALHTARSAYAYGRARPDSSLLPSCSRISKSCSSILSVMASRPTKEGRTSLFLRLLETLARAVNSA